MSSAATPVEGAAARRPYLACDRDSSATPGWHVIEYGSLEALALAVRLTSYHVVSQSDYYSPSHNRSESGCIVLLF